MTSQDSKDCSGPVMASVVRLFVISMFFHFAEPKFVVQTICWKMAQSGLQECHGSERLQ